MKRITLSLLSGFLLSACSLTPKGFDPNDPSSAGIMPHEMTGIIDGRSRFRQITCAVFEERQDREPHYESCDQALRTIDFETESEQSPVDLSRSMDHLVAAFIPGIGWECFENWMDYESEFGSMDENLGYKSFVFEVDGLSGSVHNSKQIRDQILEKYKDAEPKSLVLIGYSKGINDTLEALVRYPEIHRHVAAVVSVAGAVKGSPLALDVDENDLGLMQHIPKADCSDGDGLALNDLLPESRQNWFNEHNLDLGIPFYTLVTMPEPEEISNLLHLSYRRLAETDPRNDGQMITNDQVLPQSTFLGYLNADHWAVAVPIAEEHPMIAGVFVDQNTYPRTSLAEAVLRFIEEDLHQRKTAD